MDTWSKLTYKSDMIASLLLPLPTFSPKQIAPIAKGEIREVFGDADKTRLLGGSRYKLFVQADKLGHEEAFHWK